MKRLLLSLLTLISIQAMGVVENEITLDFSKPWLLNPNPTFTENQIPQGTGDVMQVTNYTFSSGPVTISFKKNSGDAGAAIYRNGDFFALSLRKMCYITVSVAGGCQLNSFYINGANSLILVSGEPQRWDPFNSQWTATSSNVTSVTLQQGTVDARINQITVKYNSPATPLVFSSSKPESGSTVAAFKNMELYFNTSVNSVNSSSNITLTGTGINGSLSMTAQSYGSTVLLTSPKTIDYDGTFTVTVPAHTFTTSEGASNASSIVVNFNVLSKRDTFNPKSVDPASGSTIGELPQAIKLTFDNFVKLGTGSVKFTQTDGTLTFPASVAVDKNVATISHEYGAIVDAGTWKVEIPAGLFHNPFMGDEVEDRWNEALVLNYTVDGSQVDPGPGPNPQDSETMKAAKALLQQSGVGYPTAESAARKALEALVYAEETPTDEALAEAMTAFYNETEVNMPVVGKWYKIAGVNAQNKMLYLAFNEDQTKVLIDTDVYAAGAFKVSSIEGNVIVFETKEGKFLHVLTSLPNYDATSDKNLTDELTDVNKLTLAKFVASSVEGASAEALLGKFTIFGSLGKHANGLEGAVYALLNYETNGIASDPSMPLEFGNTLSNAFIFLETSEPDPGNYIYPSVGFRPSDSIDHAGDELMLIVHGPTKTTIADGSLPFFTLNGMKVNFTEGILTPTETDNVFSVNTAGLVAGLYQLVLPVGTFSYTAPTGKQIKEIEMTGFFTVKDEGAGPGPGPGPEYVTPTATLSKAELTKPGEELVLTIGGVKKATLATDAKPYYIYAEGDKAGEDVPFGSTILTKKSDTEFSVNTNGLAYGNKYTLVVPKGTFTYELADEGKTVNDVELTATFSIKEKSSTDPDFIYGYNSFMIYFPADKIRTSEYYADVDLNELIVYVYDFMFSGLIPNPEAQVRVRDTLSGGMAMTGRFVEYPDFAADYGSEFAGTYAMKFVPDTPMQAGDLDNHGGIYGYFVDDAAFGDANYGLWLADHDSVNPEDCIVNAKGMLASYAIKNQYATIIDITTDNESQTIYDLQGRRVDNTSKKGVYIINGKKVVVK